MGQPDIQQTFNAVSVEGFEQIYQPPQDEAQSGPDEAQIDPPLKVQGGPALEIQPDPSEGVSLEDAARLLGLHMDTVRKRLQKGKIKGFKVADKFGEKWLVHRDSLPKSDAVQAGPPPQARIAPEPIRIDPAEIQPTASASEDDPIVEVEVAPAQVQDDPSLPRIDPEHARLMGIIESQAHQLKAAGDVIVYLRNEIDDAKSQLKLLTDRRKEEGFWVRLFTFFRSRETE